MTNENDEYYYRIVLDDNGYPGQCFCADTLESALDVVKFIDLHVDRYIHKHLFDIHLFRVYYTDADEE